MMKYRVHLYRVVRVDYEIDADSQLEAIDKADRNFDPFDLRRGEDAEECVGYLVDEVGDNAFDNTILYSANREPSPPYVAKPPRTSSRAPRFKATIDVLIEADSEPEACDAISEALRPMLRVFCETPTAWIDWQYAAVPDSHPTPHDGAGFEYA